MVHVVIGTKAQLIKMAPVLCELKKNGIAYRYISTGQHHDTMDEILDNFQLNKPDIILYSGPDIVSIPQMILWSIRILWKVLLHSKDIFLGDRNAIVLVHGDTFSTLLGALMGRVAGIKVAHVESGLRSFNLFQPFPEEFMRLLVFRLSNVMFCPGEWALKNVNSYKASKVNTFQNTLCDSLSIGLPAIMNSQVDYPKQDFGIVTLHRFENFKSQESTKKVVEAVESIAQKYPLLFILHKPTHRNLLKHGFYKRLATNSNITLCPRYDYFKFLKLLTVSRFVISDGGSNQEECFYLGKPTLLLRNVTERCEGIGRNVIVSEFKKTKIEEFLLNLEKLTFPYLEKKVSPSQIIATYCSQYAGENT